MAFWSTFWGLLFVVCILGFAGLAVVVAVGGVSDIRSLFRSIEEQHERGGEEG